MLTHWLDRLGDWNPQLLRELKGRLRPQSVRLTIELSLLIQILIVLQLFDQLPQPAPWLTPADLADWWQHWWTQVFAQMNWVGCFGLILMGVYLLVDDLHKETQRGTLNAIQLTPRSTAELLTGKLLGVPILVYLFVAAGLPLYLFAGLSSGLSATAMVMFYAVAIAGVGFFYSAAIWFGLTTAWLGRGQPVLAVSLTALSLWAILLNSTTLNWEFVWCQPSAAVLVGSWLKLFNPLVLMSYVNPGAYLIGFWKLVYTRDCHTFELAHFYTSPVGAHLWSATAIALANFGIWIYWLWQSIHRYFRSPHATLLSKPQSYAMTICFEVMVLGFATNPIETPLITDQYWDNLSTVFALHTCFFLFLIAALSPQRQTLKNWARSLCIRSDSGSQHQRLSSFRLSLSPLQYELIWGENSPSPISMMINCGIMLMFLMPWTLFLQADRLMISLIFLVLSSIGLTSAAIAQLVLYEQSRNPVLWAIGVVACFVVPFTSIWLFICRDYLNASADVSVAILIAICLFLFGFLSWQLINRLKQTGQLLAIPLLKQQ